MSKALAHSANVLANLSGADTLEMVSKVHGIETVVGGAVATASIETVVIGTPMVAAVSTTAMETIKAVEGDHAANGAAIGELLL